MEVLDQATLVDLVDKLAHGHLLTQQELERLEQEPDDMPVEPVVVASRATSPSMPFNLHAAGTDEAARAACGHAQPSTASSDRPVAAAFAAAASQLERSSAADEAVSIEDAGHGLNQGPSPIVRAVKASECRLAGDGLTEASVRIPASFTIEAPAAAMQPGPSHGFTCVIRPAVRGGRGIRNVVIEENLEEGILRVRYTPTSAGKFLVHVALHGEPLPGSPAALAVVDGAVCLEKCSVDGAALAQAVARRVEAFEVHFRDKSGNAAHAVELDVYVQRTNDAHDDGSLPSPITQEALDAGLELVVADAPLAVRASLAPAAERIGTIAPGRPLKVLKLERLEDFAELTGSAAITPAGRMDAMTADEVGGGWGRGRGALRMRGDARPRAGAAHHGCTAHVPRHLHG